LLGRIEPLFAGRAFAAYCGVYIYAFLLWLWVIEGQRPDKWDILGAAICIVGTAIILLGSRDPKII
jgi:small multidrug resistance family-3 protein